MPHGPITGEFDRWAAALPDGILGVDATPIGEEHVVTLPEPKVHLAAGGIRGKLESDVVVFKGVPFADLPARFAAPQRVTASAGTLAALSFGPPPP